MFGAVRALEMKLKVFRKDFVSYFLLWFVSWGRISKCSFSKCPGCGNDWSLPENFKMRFSDFHSHHHHHHHRCRRRCRRLSRITPLNMFRFRIYFLKLMNLFWQFVGLFGWAISPTQDFYLHAGQHDTEKLAHKSMPHATNICVFENPFSVEVGDTLEKFQLGLNCSMTQFCLEASTRIL
jgi:hypothetical protein